MEQSSLCDDLGRKVRYLRVSITDRCNLRCLYCQSNRLSRYIPHDDILKYEEILRLLHILVPLGVEKVRLTGGEPLARKGCGEFLGRLREHFPNLDLRLTTNGTMLSGSLQDLVQCKINAVNISLDTFDPETFTKVTGRDMLPRVLSTIDALVDAGIKVKINAVLMPGITQASLEQFIHLAQDLDIDVRFIEFMPMGQDTIWSKDAFCPWSEILALVTKNYELIPEKNVDLTAGPAQMFKFKGAPGRLGFISPITNHFCYTCNRLRLTSDGSLRLCLYDDHEYPVRPLLRDAYVTDEQIAAKILEVLRKKTLGVGLLERRGQNKPVAVRNMSGIGG
ncbi:MAG: GTP 3',8-cyclase MoaA [Desulfovibrionaceae bacterium]|nr:GTP 3',8-cyclase MoaA [Desulfovibrionaceae bacterium]